MRRLGLFLVLSLAAADAKATFHLVRVSEVYAGSAAAPNAQYIEMEETASEGNIAGKTVQVFAADGTTVRGTATIRADLGSVGDGGTFIVATDEALALFDAPAVSSDGDLEPAGAIGSEPIIDPAGGKLCFAGSTDCVAWGAYTGATGGVGSAFAPDGLVLGRAFERRRNAGNLVDTGQSLTDFQWADAPTPQGKADVGPGAASDATCGDGAAEEGEGCDDNGTGDDDGCSGSCQIEFCGDGVVQTGEDCDDGNYIAADACAADCTSTGVVPECGDGVLDDGEECDDGNDEDGDGCSFSCTLEDTDDGVDDEEEDGGCQGTPGTLLGALLAAAGLFRRRRGE